MSSAIHAPSLVITLNDILEARENRFYQAIVVLRSFLRVLGINYDCVFGGRIYQKTNPGKASSLRLNQNPGQITDEFFLKDPSK